MTDPKRYTITAALPYANGPLHVGHIAGAYLPADIYVRYLRLKQKDVAFICGSDEHGAAITLQAKKEGIPPGDIVNKYHELNKRSFEGFGIDFDIFHRTSSKLHHQTAQEFFTYLHNKGVFIEKETEQYYDEEYQQFLADRYIVGTCPKCGFDQAYGDQCENCGSSLSPDELKHPLSKLSGKKPVKRKTTHWYLPLDKYEDWLRQWIVDGSERKEEWKPNVAGQCKSWLDGHLQARSITRDLEWGVKVPLSDTEGKVLYVWLDAPIGYISATKKWAQEHNKDWKPYWQDEATKLVHFIGKDNIVFHCIIFPTILKEMDDYTLPWNVPANEFMNLEGRKISTSRNWAVWLHEYLEEFPAKQDVLRYYLCANAPEFKDSEFTWKDFQDRNNNELVANLGNFVNRAVVLTHKYFNGEVPPRNELTDQDNALLKKLRSYPAKVERSLENYRFREALSQAMDVARIGNKYLGDTEPWKLWKTDNERVETVLNTALQVVSNLAVVFEPFLPYTAEKLRRMLNVDSLTWEAAGQDNVLEAGHKLNKPELLFEKLDDSVIEQQMDKLQQQDKSNQQQYEPVKDTIEFDDFLKLDLRAGKIIAAEKVKKADKLLKLTVDMGFEKRTVVSGIAKQFKPEELPGTMVTVVANLAPRKLKGIQSQGMVLMAEDAEGTLKFVSPQEGSQPGSVVS